MKLLYILKFRKGGWLYLLRVGYLNISVAVFDRQSEE
jgi:hypothetical protein